MNLISTKSWLTTTIQLKLQPLPPIKAAIFPAPKQANQPPVKTPLTHLKTGKKILRSPPTPQEFKSINEATKVPAQFAQNWTPYLRKISENMRGSKKTYTNNGNSFNGDTLVAKWSRTTSSTTSKNSTTNTRRSCKPSKTPDRRYKQRSQETIEITIASIRRCSCRPSSSIANCQSMPRNHWLYRPSISMISSYSRGKLDRGNQRNSLKFYANTLISLQRRMEVCPFWSLSRGNWPPRQ